MGFDAILGVGRSPQVTKDIIINPYTFIVTDISDSAKLTVTGAIPATITGVVENINDPDYDNVNIAYHLQGIRSNPYDVYLIADLEREVYLKQVNINLGITSALHDVTIKLSVSNDGVQYIDVQSITPVAYATNTIVPLNARYIKGRFIKVSIETSGSGATDVIDFYKLKIILDNLQR